MPTVDFVQMKDGTAQDYQLLHVLENDYIRALPDRLLLALERLGDSIQGYQVSRLHHSLQSASLAEADGADIETIVAALVHDLGDELAPENHSPLAYKDHPWYASCWRFCERYDQAAFDPATPTRPLSYFEPMLREVFSRKPFDPAILKEPAKA